MRRHDPGEFARALHPLDLVLATPEQCDAGRALAANLISQQIATAATFRRVQEKTRSTVFVFLPAGELTGALGMIPINPAGLDAICNHRFDPRNPPSEYLCAPGESFAAVYGWGIAGSTRKAAAVVIAGVKALRDSFTDIPFFTRTATSAGDKVVRGRLGYSPYPGAPDDLLWNPVRTAQERAA